MDRNSRARGPDAQLNLAWWLDHLTGAASMEAIVAVVHDFIRAWPASKIDELPPAYRPGRLDSANDISGYAVTLARAQLKGDHHAPHLHAMAIFFTDAAMRLSEFLTISHREEARRRMAADLDEET